MFLASDPFPEVADLAQQVVHGVHNKVGVGDDEAIFLHARTCTCTVHLSLSLI